MCELLVVYQFFFPIWQTRALVRDYYMQASRGLSECSRVVEIAFLTVSEAGAFIMAHVMV